jgi:CRP-like cAMP-binding protein
MNAAEKATALGRSAVFAKLHVEELALFAAMLRVEEFRAGATVCERGEVADNVAILVSGELAVYVQNDSIVARALHPGDVFGEYGMVTKGLRTATVRVVSDAVLLTVDNERFRSFLFARPEAMWALFSLAVQRLAEAERG